MDNLALSSLGFSRALALAVERRSNGSQSAGEALASLTSVIPGVVYQRAVRPNGEIRYTYISESAYELFGDPATEIIENPGILFARYSPEYRAGFRERLIEASRTLSPWDVEASILMEDGSEKFTHAIAKPKLQPDGSVLWTGVIMDATRIKRAEAAVAAAEIGQFRLLYRNHRLCVVRVVVRDEDVHRRQLSREHRATWLIATSYADDARG